MAIHPIDCQVCSRVTVRSGSLYAGFFASVATAFLLSSPGIDAYIMQIVVFGIMGIRMGENLIGFTVLIKVVSFAYTPKKLVRDYLTCFEYLYIW